MGGLVWLLCRLATVQFTGGQWSKEEPGLWSKDKIVGVCEGRRPTERLVRQRLILM